MSEFFYYLLKYTPFFLAAPAIGTAYFWIKQFMRDHKER